MRSASTDRLPRVRPRSNSRRSTLRKSSSQSSPMARWSVYIVRCRNGALYTGIATDVRRRIAEHAQSNGKGAKYLRGKGPLRLVFVRAIGTKGSALRVESQLKMLPKAQKEKLVHQFRRSAGGFNIAARRPGERMNRGTWVAR